MKINAVRGEVTDISAEKNHCCSVFTTDVSLPVKLKYANNYSDLCTAGPVIIEFCIVSPELEFLSPNWYIPSHKPTAVMMAANQPRTNGGKQSPIHTKNKQQWL